MAEKKIKKIGYSDGINTYKYDLAQVDTDIADLKSKTQDATESSKGIVELASTQEITSGTSGCLVVTAEKLKAVTDAIRVEINNAGQFRSELAFKDYTQPQNQTDLDKPENLKVYFQVPFNANDEFLEFDPETGKPKNPQPVGSVTDLVVSYYKSVYKFDTSSPVLVGQPQYNTPQFEDVAHLKRQNTFTKKNTFTSGTAVEGGLTVDTISGSGTLDITGMSTLTGGVTTSTVHASGAATFDTTVTVTGALTATTGAEVSGGGTNVPNAGQVKTYVDSFKPQAVTALPDSGSMTQGVIYFEYAE